MTNPNPQPQGSFDSLPVPGKPTAPPKQDPAGFARFRQKSAFIKHVHQQGMVPLWAHPQVAKALVAQHATTGLVIPHPNLDTGDLNR